MAPKVRNTRATTPTPKKSDTKAQESGPVSKTANVDKANAKVLPKEKPVTKPDEEAVANKKYRLSFKVLGAVIVVLFIVSAMMMMMMTTTGSAFAITIKETITACCSKIYTTGSAFAILIKTFFQSFFQAFAITFKEMITAFCSIIYATGSAFAITTKEAITAFCSKVSPTSIAFAITTKETITAFCSKIYEKAAFFLTENKLIVAVCAIVLLGATGLVAYVVRKRSRSKKVE